MSFLNRGVWKCDDCGHEWLAGGEKKPARCPSRKCRSSHWDHENVGVPQVVSVEQKVIGPVKVGVPSGPTLRGPKVSVLPGKNADGGHDYAGCRNRFCLICKLKKEGK